MEYIMQNTNDLHNKLNESIKEEPKNNDRFKEIVKQPININKKEIQKIEIFGDGNCLYRCLSFFYSLLINFMKKLKMKL